MLIQAKQNYEVYDCELLAIVESLKHWQHHLEGHLLTMIIRCDHKNLRYYKQLQSLTTQQIQWQQWLSEFNVKLVYTPGSKLIVPDSLSRWLDHRKEVPIRRTVVPDSMIISTINIDLQTNIRHAYQ